ncbi:thymidylate synthase [Kwoniella dejecticola CBS 10117]|uniref:thymidylate synthase n=1 Tax=Kwoniella dejecticola CBS 10117 TaxID=1296121 RepID=A0A1A6ABT9_9TREE|nr:thymidylate synthase [Kwoniella dejecticola CBS 10117]OBR87531.1 thymidylate synthase [Kwoniella dejecticola CBS 10117]
MTNPIIETNGVVNVNGTKSLTQASKGRANPDHEEYQYLDLISRIMAQGQSRPDRTGTGTLALFAPPSFRFSLENSILPLLTTKRVFLRGVIAELLWFVNGSTDSKLLSDQGVGIWDGNGSKEFLTKNGLGHRREGDLGPVYGFQWRHFGAEYTDADGDYRDKGVDQLKEVIWKIKNNPTDRRIILSAWNPKDLPLMALPPCHMFCQFYVTLPSPSIADDKPKLSCLMYQRSCDLGLGVPFNIASYALLTHMIAYITDTVPHEFILQMGDSHIYKDHVDPLKIQLEREPRDFPTLRFKRTREEIGDIDGFTVDDFVVEGYKPHGKIEMKMSLRLGFLQHRMSSAYVPIMLF